MIVAPPTHLLPSNPYTHPHPSAADPAHLDSNSDNSQSRHSFTFGVDDNLTLTRPDPPADPPLPPRALRQRPLDESAERVSQTKRRQRHVSADIAFSRSMSASSSLPHDSRSSRSNSSVVHPSSADARLVRDTNRLKDRDDPSSLHRVSSQNALLTNTPSLTRQSYQSTSSSTPSKNLITTSALAVSAELRTSPNTAQSSPHFHTKRDSLSQSSQLSPSPNRYLTRNESSRNSPSIQDYHSSRTQTPPRVDKPPRARKIVSFNENVHIVTYPYEDCDTLSSNSDVPSALRFAENMQFRRRGRSVFRLLSRSNSNASDSEDVPPLPIEHSYEGCLNLPLDSETDGIFDSPSRSASTDSHQYDPPGPAMLDAQSRKSTMIPGDTPENTCEPIAEPAAPIEGAVADDFDYEHRRDSDNAETLSLSDAHPSCDGIDEPLAIVDQLFSSSKDNGIESRATSSFDIAPLWQRLKRVDELDAVNIPRRALYEDELRGSVSQSEINFSDLRSGRHNDVMPKRSSLAFSKQSRNHAKAHRILRDMIPPEFSDDDDMPSNERLKEISWRSINGDLSAIPESLDYKGAGPSTVRPPSPIRAPSPPPREPFPPPPTAAEEEDTTINDSSSNEILLKKLDTPGTCDIPALQEDISIDHPPSEVPEMPLNSTSDAEEDVDANYAHLATPDQTSVLEPTVSQRQTLEHQRLPEKFNEITSELSSEVRTADSRPLPEVKEDERFVDVSEEKSQSADNSRTISTDEAEETFLDAVDDAPFEQVGTTNIASTSAFEANYGTDIPQSADVNVGVQQASPTQHVDEETKPTSGLEAGDKLFPEATSAEKEEELNPLSVRSHSQDRELPSLGPGSRGRRRNRSTLLDDRHLLSVDTVVQQFETASPEQDQRNDTGSSAKTSGRRRNTSKTLAQMLSSGDSSGSSSSEEDKVEEGTQQQTTAQTREQNDHNSDGSHTDQGSYSELDLDEIRLSPPADDMSGIDRAFSPLAVVYYGTSSPVVDQLPQEGETQPTEALVNYPEYDMLKGKEETTFTSEPTTPLLNRRELWDGVDEERSGTLGHFSERTGRDVQRDSGRIHVEKKASGVPEVLLHEWSGSVPVEPSVEMEDSAPNSSSSSFHAHEVQRDEFDRRVRRSVRLSSKSLGAGTSTAPNNHMNRYDSEIERSVKFEGHLNAMNPDNGVAEQKNTFAHKQGGTIGYQNRRRLGETPQSNRRRGASDHGVVSGGRGVLEGLLSSDYVNEDRANDANATGNYNGDRTTDGSGGAGFQAALPTGYAVDPKLQDFQLSVERKSISEIGYRPGMPSAGRGTSFIEYDYGQGAGDITGDAGGYGVGGNGGTRAYEVNGRGMARGDGPVTAGELGIRRKQGAQRRRRLSNVELSGNVNSDGAALRGMMGRLVSGMHLAKKLVTPNPN